LCVLLSVFARIRDATTKLRNTTLYKNAVKFKEKIAESENPVIQKTLEWSDATSYHLGRMRRRLFSETETARAFNAIRAYVPKFDPMSFVDNARTQMIPKLRGALLRYDLDTIEPLVHPTVSTHLSCSLSWPYRVSLSVPSGFAARKGGTLW